MAKQTEIKGAERKKIKAIDDAAEEYRKLRNSRMKLAVKEEAARVVLAEKLKENGMKPVSSSIEDEVVYAYDDGDGEQNVIWCPPRVKVKGASSSNGAETE